MSSIRVQDSIEKRVKKLESNMALLSNKIDTLINCIGINVSAKTVQIDANSKGLSLTDIGLEDVAEIISVQDEAITELAEIVSTLVEG